MPVFLITSTDIAAGASVFVSAISHPVDISITIYMALSSFNVTQNLSLGLMA